MGRLAPDLELALEADATAGRGAGEDVEGGIAQRPGSALLLLLAVVVVMVVLVLLGQAGGRRGERDGGAGE
jgi:hypothetical protein